MSAAAIRREGGTLPHEPRPRAAVRVAMAAGLASVAIAALVPALYVVKSAAGINLMAGKSTLHDAFYPAALALRAATKRPPS